MPFGSPSWPQCVMAAVYVVIVLAFNHVDRERLVNGVGDRLDSRLAAVAKAPDQAAAIAQYDNAHDLDDAPVFFWAVHRDGRRTALTPGAPGLSEQAWATARLRRRPVSGTPTSSSDR